MSCSIPRSEKATSLPILFPICLSIKPMSIPKTFRFDNLPSVSLFLARLTSLPAAKNASGSNGVSSSGNSSSMPRTVEKFFKNEPSPIVSRRGSLIWLSVYLATAVSKRTAFSQIVSIRLT